MNSLFPKKVRAIMWLIFALGILAAGAGISLQWDPLCYLGILVMLGGVVFHLIFYRCPHCGKFLDRSTGDYCPYCGQRVNPEEPPDDK